MNQTRVSVAILLVLLMGAGWMVLLGGQASQSAAQSDAIELARSYRDQELYAMSIQNYEQGAGTKSLQGALSGAGGGLPGLLRPE